MPPEFDTIYFTKDGQCDLLLKLHACLPGGVGIILRMMFECKFYGNGKPPQDIDAKLAFIAGVVAKSKKPSANDKDKAADPESREDEPPVKNVYGIMMYGSAKACEEMMKHEHGAIALYEEGKGALYES
jgi:hypothetical protein